MGYRDSNVGCVTSNALPVFSDTYSDAHHVWQVIKWRNHGMRIVTYNVTYLSKHAKL